MSEDWLEGAQVFLKMRLMAIELERGFDEVSNCKKLKRPNLL